MKNLLSRKVQYTAPILPRIPHAKILNQENRRTVKALLLQFETISSCGKKKRQNVIILRDNFLLVQEVFVKYIYKYLMRKVTFGSPHLLLLCAVSISLAFARKKKWNEMREKRERNGRRTERLYANHFRDDAVWIIREIDYSQLRAISVCLMTISHPIRTRRIIFITHKKIKQSHLCHYLQIFIAPQ